MKTRFRAAIGTFAFAIACLLSTAGTALADQEITSAGPLTSIYLGENLDCQADHVGDIEGHEWFGEQPGACGTFLAPEGTADPEEAYGPDVPAGVPRTPFTPVSQSDITGDGTSANPYQVVTVVDLGETGLQIRQTDSYVVGDEFYRTDIEVLNGTDADINAVLYHSADCQLQGSDDGYGFYDSASGGIYCSEKANNSPASRIEGFSPLSSGSHYLETEYEANWLAADGTSLPDTCDCDFLRDNGAGLSWEITVPASGSVIRSLLTTFSPTGETPPPPIGPPANLSLDPVSATNPIDTEHCVTATVTDANDNPNGDVPVVFGVSGASSDSGTVTTDASGQAQFCYTGPGLPGSDEITAFADTDSSGGQNGDEPSGSATKRWEGPDSNCGVKVTGAGWIQTSSGGWGHLNVNVKTKKKQGLEGKVRFSSRGIDINSWDVQVEICDDGTVTLFGVATVNGSRNHQFRIDLSDRGKGDTVRIRTDTGYDSGAQSVQRGNIKVHKK